MFINGCEEYKFLFFRYFGCGVVNIKLKRESSLVDVKK